MADRAGSAGGPPAPRRWHDRGYLPHFDKAGVCQTITYRLADSLPSDVTTARRRVRTTPADRRLIEDQLDSGYGSCVLRRPHIARVVIESWKHFDGDRYQLIAWVVMPNHVHVMIRVHRGQSLSRIVHSWKSFTAKVIARAERIPGRVWHPDYWDRFIRDEKHFRAAAAYILENPVKAGLVSCAGDWPWSSAAGAGGPPALPG
jgi:REP element-mobilizing transposase RayT